MPVDLQPAAKRLPASFEAPRPEVPAAPVDRLPPALEPGRHALFLDFDGTFVDFAPEPDAIKLRPGQPRDPRTVEPAPARRARHRVRAAKFPTSTDISRRSSCRPRACTARKSARRRATSAPGRRAPISTAPAGGSPPRSCPNDPLLVEDKGAALVLHFRKHPEQRARAEALAAAAVAGLSDLYAIEGHAIFEIRQRDVSKATAIELFGNMRPFAGRLPVFVGDDSTDEDGFRAAARAGGFGVKVGPGSTGAAYRLPDVSAVHVWLRKLAGL